MFTQPPLNKLPGCRAKRPGSIPAGPALVRTLGLQADGETLRRHDVDAGLPAVNVVGTRLVGW